MAGAEIVRHVTAHVLIVMTNTGDFLYTHQKKAIDKLKSGSILVGGVGSGKSRTALAYFNKEFKERDLYIITTARKRDTLEWEDEYKPFKFKINVIIDSWNNISKYTHIKDSFFIFDEQRVIGNGVWVKSFLKITKSNKWILLSATPGDTWMDYVPVFIANNFYKNRTEFIRRHVVYKPYSKYPKIERYSEVSRLVKLRDTVIVIMKYKKKTVEIKKNINAPFDKEKFNTVFLKRWNFYENSPIQQIGEVYFLMRKVVNSDPRRIDIVAQILEKHPKVIVFYNFNYERDLLLELGKTLGIKTNQLNGHKHEQIPTTKKWMYIVQYAAGAEAWNCVETDTIIFYSQNYSYRTTIQAAGRIDRMNTPFTKLYYYYLRSNSYIDISILKAFKEKRNFNELPILIN